MARIRRVIVSCEHGGAGIPAAHRALFRSARARAALASHRGFDAGALGLARLIARELRAPLHYSTTSRLLVELNRSLHHRALFSEFSAGLGDEEKRAVIERHYLPHRRAVEAAVRGAIADARGGAALHLSVHSFTPVLNGLVRTADVGLLYDPRRAGEAEFCAVWREAMLEAASGLRVRRNYPYLGRADGFTTALRRVFPAERYLGIELEVNQAILTGGLAERRRVQEAVAASLRSAIAQ